MGGGHAGVDSLFVHGPSPIHVLAPEAKLVATLGFVLAVVATPREAIGAFAVYLALVLAVAAVAHIPFGFLLRRARIEIPFLAFAVFLPLVGEDPRVDVAGLSLSRPGLWAAWTIVAKGTLGVLASIVLAATTPVADLLRGMARLRVPATFVAITGFMVRYLGVLLGEAGRMRVARLSRADDPRWIWQARATAMAAGTLFIRSYERGERVRLAMLARGYDGTPPDLDGRTASRRDWLVAAVLPLAAGAVAVLAWWWR